MNSQFCIYCNYWYCSKVDRVFFNFFLAEYTRSLESYETNLTTITLGLLVLVSLLANLCDLSISHGSSVTPSLFRTTSRTIDLVFSFSSSAIPVNLSVFRRPYWSNSSLHRTSSALVICNFSLTILIWEISSFSTWISLIWAMIVDFKETI